MVPVEFVLVVVAHYGIGRNEAANAANPIESNPIRWSTVMLPMKQRIAVRTNITTEPIKRKILIIVPFTSSARSGAVPLV